MHSSQQIPVTRTTPCRWAAAVALMARAPAAGAQSAATLASRRPMLAVHAFRKLPTSCTVGIELDVQAGFRVYGLAVKAGLYRLRRAFTVDCQDRAGCLYTAKSDKSSNDNAITSFSDIPVNGTFKSIGKVVG